MHPGSVYSITMKYTDQKLMDEACCKLSDVLEAIDEGVFYNEDKDWEKDMRVLVALLQARRARKP